MKITVVLGAFFPVPPTMGGAVEKAWFALAHEFASRGHEVTMVSRAMPALPREEFTRGIRHLRVAGFDTPRSLIWLKLLDLVYSLRARRILPRADILVTNTFWLPLLVRDSQRGNIYVHVGRYPKGQMRFYKRAARLQAPSSEIAEAIAREAPSLRARTIAIPYPGPPANAAEPSFHAREKIVLYVGRVHPEKGVHLLVEAFAGSELAGWKLVVTGSTETKYGGGGGEYAARLRDLAGNADVEFHGPIFDQAQLQQQYSRARIFLYPSLAVHGETFGLAPLEAMSHACAVIVSSLACFREFIIPGQTGFVFSENTAESLAGTLRSVIANESDLARVAEAGRHKSEEFSLPRVADRFLADFQTVILHGERADR
ncbi:MAG: glycosyltransferase family 4 protein [Verrucomicrobia bacterium]|nr:glycosyltransferase family 4 protein [Verrucomicrobiota bacterium]